MKKLSNIIKGLCLAGCLLPCLFAAPEVQAAKDPTETATGQAVLFSKREKLKQACSQFEEVTGCKVLVTSSIDAEYGDESLEDAIMAIFKGLARRAAVHQNAISINVVWKGTATYSDSIAVGVDNVTKGVFAEDALREFRDTLQRYQEAMASIEETKVHEKITEALERLQEGAIQNSGNFELQLFEGEQRFSREAFLLITDEPAMPKIRIKPFREGYTGDKEVNMRLEISYQRDGIDNKKNPIVDLRTDVSAYPPNGWQSVKINEEWSVDFGKDIRGGTAYLICRDSSRVDTVSFYIRGANPKESAIKGYMSLKGYYPKYWFIIKMTRQESSLYQFFNEKSYNKNKLSGKRNAKGEPYYGPPKGFGLKQLDNWGTPNRNASAQHLWSWKENIDGGVEVIEEKKAEVDKDKVKYEKMIKSWNFYNANNPVSDSLKITGGDNTGTWVLTIIEGKETFAVKPTGQQRDVYDAFWIKLFNGGPRYYRVVQTNKRTRPLREIHRSDKNAASNNYKNYVHDVCSKDD